MNDESNALTMIKVVSDDDESTAPVLTIDDLRTLKRLARAYRALGWVLGALLTVSGGLLALYDLLDKFTKGTH